MNVLSSRPSLQWELLCACILQGLPLIETLSIFHEPYTRISPRHCTLVFMQKIASENNDDVNIFNLTSYTVQTLVDMYRHNMNMLFLGQWLPHVQKYSGGVSPPPLPLFSIYPPLSPSPPRLSIISVCLSPGLLNEDFLRTVARRWPPD